MPALAVHHARSRPCLTWAPPERVLWQRVEHALAVHRPREALVASLHVPLARCMAFLWHKAGAEMCLSLQKVMLRGRCGVPVGACGRPGGRLRCVQD